MSFSTLTASCFYVIFPIVFINIHLIFKKLILTLLPDGKYSTLLTAAAFSSKSFSDKTSLPVKNSYLPTFPDDKAEILAVCLSKLYRALSCSILLTIVRRATKIFLGQGRFIGVL